MGAHDSSSVHLDASRVVGTRIPADIIIGTEVVLMLVISVVKVSRAHAIE